MKKIIITFLICCSLFTLNNSVYAYNSTTTQVVTMLLLTDAMDSGNNKQQTNQVVNKSENPKTKNKNDLNSILFCIGIISIIFFIILFIEALNDEYERKRRKI